MRGSPSGPGIYGREVNLRGNGRAQRSSLVTIVTSWLVNRPRTLPAISRRTGKPISERTGSAVQVPAR